MIGKKINQLATELAPVSTDLTIIGDPTTGVSKKITLAQLGAIFSGAVSFYTNLAAFPNPGTTDVIYCAKDTQKLYLWSGSAYVEVFPSQALLNTYQLRSEKGNANGYASLDSGGKVPISQLPSSIMEYKGTWNAATNTPTLANGTGDTGDVYICNVAGTVDFGAGPLTFAVGDYTIYSGSIWQRSSGAVGTVTSVAATITGDAIGITGSPVTTSGTLAFAFAGTGAQYIKGDGTLATFPTTIDQAKNLITEVYNSTGATLTKGTVVYINGGQGNLPTVTKALATGDSTSAQTYGIVQADITNNNNGFVVVAGRLSDIDTQAFSVGAQLYLSSTTAGAYTSTKQYAPAHLVYVGIIVRSHPTQGIIEVKIQNGYELDELHNVAAQSPDNNDILQYKTATSLWTKVAGTTSNIAEGSNLYYTDARSRAALSFTAGSGAYNSTTGVITIPTNNNQITNGANYITLASLSAGAGISYNNTTGVIASTITQYTDALARASISLTTTGTSGAATYNNTTGVLNVPQYAPDLSGYVPTSRTITINGTSFDLSANRSYSVGTVTSVGLSSATSGVTIGSTPITTSGTITLAIATASGSQQGLLSSTDWTTFNNKQNALTNPVTGTGTTNYLPKFTGTSTIGNSLVSESGNGINITGSAYATLTLNSTNSDGWGTNINFQQSATAFGYLGSYGSLVGSTTKDMTIWATSGNGFRVNVNNSSTSALILNTSGNLGLGVTPSAWASGYKVAQYQGGFVGSDGTSYIYFGQNAYSDGTFKYLANGLATIYAQDAGKYIWYQAPSGTAGNAITFTPAMTLDASGNLGLGTTSPSGYGSGYPTMDLRGSVGSGIKIGNATDVALLYANSTATYLRTSSAKDLILGTFDTPRLTITSGGNVGIGTTSPSARLDVVGSAGIRVNEDGAGTKVIQIRSDFAGVDPAINVSTNNALLLQTNNTERMRITSAGNVGIGTNNPSGKLTVYGGQTEWGNTSSLGALSYSGSDPVVAAIGATNLLIYTNSTERMRITSGGNVEINTGSIKTGEPDTGYGRAAIKIGARNTGQAFNSGGHLPVNIDGTIYFINVYSSLP